MIKVLLADDHTIVRKGIRSLLESEEDIKVVGEAANGREAMDKVRQLKPEIVVMDISMPVLNGIGATRQIKEQYPKVKILVLTLHSDKKYILNVLKAGATGYLVKESVPEELIAAIHDVHQGDSYLSPLVAKVVVDEYVEQSGTPDTRNRYEELTDRECEVLQLIAEGYPTLEIAEQLDISIDAVVKCRSVLVRKLDIHNPAELIQYAIQNQIVE